jgi:predicted PurR-regulated permease PerM
MDDQHTNRVAEYDGPSVRRAGGIDRAEFARRAAIAVAVVALGVALTAALVRAADVFFLFFLAVLLAILLRAAAGAVGRYTSLGPGWSLAVVVAALAALLAGGLYAVGSVVAGQVDALTTELPRSFDHARAYLGRYGWGRRVLETVPSADDFLFDWSGGAAAAVASFFSTTLGAIGNLVVLAFLTLYLAAAPRTYVNGLLTLVPPRHRGRAGQVVAAAGHQLRWWLVGRLAAMLVVGVIVGVGLWAVGVPQFLVLGLLAAALNSIPYLGPVAAAVPGTLLALVQGPTALLWALGVYLVAQSVDNYLVTPLVQQRTVDMPPVVSILAVVLAAALFGVLGLIAAAPLAVVLIVVVRMLYVEDVLGEPERAGTHVAPATG